MPDVKDTLADREKIYGDFLYVATTAQNLKDDMRHTRGWNALSMAKQEALDMIATKIGRILNEGANHADNWHDIAGYATLIERDMPIRLTPNNARE